MYNYLLEQSDQVRPSYLVYHCNPSTAPACKISRMKNSSSRRQDNWEGPTDCFGILRNLSVWKYCSWTLLAVLFAHAVCIQRTGLRPQHLQETPWPSLHLVTLAGTTMAGHHARSTFCWKWVSGSSLVMAPHGKLLATALQPKPWGYWKVSRSQARAASQKWRMKRSRKVTGLKKNTIIFRWCSSPFS